MRDEIVLYTAKISEELEVMFVLQDGDWLMRWSPELERNLSAEEEARFVEAREVFEERWKRWITDREAELEACEAELSECWKAELAAELDKREAEVFDRHWPEAHR
jgi:hypothetical protein